MLTRDRLLTELHYDLDTGLFTRRVARCNRVKVGDVAGGVSSKGEVQIRVFGRLYMAHQLAWLYVTGVWPEHEIDHRNLDRTNNAWENLRAARTTRSRSRTCGSAAASSARGSRWTESGSTSAPSTRWSRLGPRMMRWP